MQVQAMQGYFDNGSFYQQGRKVNLPERQLVIVNVLDVPVNVDETRRADIEFWKEFDELAKKTVDNELLMADFPRAAFGRDVKLLEDEAQSR